MSIYIRSGLVLAGVQLSVGTLDFKQPRVLRRNRASRRKGFWQSEIREFGRALSWQMCKVSASRLGVKQLSVLRTNKALRSEKRWPYDPVAIHRALFWQVAIR